ncbi:amidohydrolase family protein [Clostridium sp. MCC353]|uniref:amidohydrolase n=1 Tax=Clostridium sp. MCC353 TaxID=2592646 RepID=UPI001C036E73|nr:amidohydrolase [Clostridium sp. MCC353]MBT9778038.1 amidohydrolase family protein [Clostridium sp. MCC353]
MEQILYNGTFLTMDPGCREAEAVLVSEGMIKAVGKFEEICALAPDAKKKDMEGHTVLPGFIDGHSHISAVAYQLLMADLNPPPTGDCSSVEDVIRKMKEFLASRKLAPGQWLMGMGYDNSVFPDGKHPTKEDLDQISREHPVVILHVSGHLCVVNTKGMELMGYVGDHFAVPQGGVVEKSGLLKEQAFLGSDKMEGPSPEEVIRSVENASRLYASYGITTVHDGKARMSEYRLLKAAAEQGLLCNDVVIYFSPEAAEELLPHQYPALNGYHNRLRFAGMKLFLDGSPQGKTAWLSKPYYEAPEGEGKNYRGFPVQTEEDVMGLMKKAVENHWQINVHANGDEAIEQMIRCYTRTLEETGCRENLRPVIIHCQTVREDQLKRMKEIGMIASFFLDHVYYWGDYHYESVLGPERAERISPLKSALEQDISFTLHQDSPVVPPNVLFSIHNAVNRKTYKGRILGEDQRISVYEALQAVTIHGAYQIFEEDKKGSITPGKCADFVVLDQNPEKTAPERIKDIAVKEVIKEGKTIFTAPGHDGNA